MSTPDKPASMVSNRCTSLSGEAKIPGDKSISHRALILGAMAVGTTEIHNILEGQDVLDTLKAMQDFGVSIVKKNDGALYVNGVGVGGFSESDTVINCGNSGTGARLIMGAAATHDMNTTFTGDSSLNKRPMKRIVEPISLFGARFYGRSEYRLPGTIVGAKMPVPVEYILPLPSAQVKSSILLAGLNAPGKTVVIEKKGTRDHTERMLKGFGAQIDSENTPEGTVITLKGQPELEPQKINVPRDPSSAAFPICAALITEGSEITIPNIGLNPTRTGLFTTLIEMGANLQLINKKIQGGEPVGDLIAKFSPNLTGIEVPPERTASMIDEYPILSVVAAYAEGKTTMRAVEELRVKESDRIEAMATGLRANGISVEEGEDWWIIHGRGIAGVPGGGLCQTFLDHRIAMSFLVLGMNSRKPITIDNGDTIATSFPNFVQLMNELGASIKRASQK